MISSTCAISILVLPARLNSLARNLAHAMDCLASVLSREPCCPREQGAAHPHTWILHRQGADDTALLGLSGQNMSA